MGTIHQDHFANGFCAGEAGQEGLVDGAGPDDQKSLTGSGDSAVLPQLRRFRDESAASPRCTHGALVALSVVLLSTNGIPGDSARLVTGARCGVQNTCAAMILNAPRRIDDQRLVREAGATS